MKRKFLSLLTAAAITFAVLPATAENIDTETEETSAIEEVMPEAAAEGEVEKAADVELFDTEEYEQPTDVELCATSGTCGDNLTWELDTDTGVLTISGEGDMADYSYGDSPWYSNRESITEVIIKNGVTSIGNCAFHICESLTKINIPDTVTNIGESAFAQCTNLRSVVIPDGVESIADDTFLYCTSLTDITIPDSVTSIGEFAFQETGLINVVIGGGVTSIGKYAFSYCNSLNTIQIPRSVTYIGANAFSGNALNIVYYEGTSDEWDEIDNYDSNLGSFIVYGFYNIDVTVEQVIGSGNCGTDAIWSLTNFGNFTISGEGDMDDYSTSSLSPWYSMCSVIKNAEIADGITSIGAYAFRECENLENITISDSIVSIGTAAFYRCTGLTSVTIPAGVMSIGSSAFYYCTGLTSVMIPESVTSIGNYAFDGCSGLTSAGPIGGGYSYEFGWTDAIPAYAFQGCRGLTSVTIPDSVASIGSAAFSNCTVLTNITIPDSMTSIDKYTFSYCSGLTNITIPDSITSIGNAAFSGCTGLTSITIPSSVTSIDSSAFSGCTGLISAVINCISVGEYMFYNCTGLTNITLSDNIKSIAKNAFYNCTGLENVYAVSLESWLAINYNNLEAVPMYYADNLYIDGELLTNITIPDSVTSIGSYAFYGCSCLTSVTIPDSVTSIGSYAFYNCNGLTSVTIYGSTTSTGRYAFYGCTGLTSAGPVGGGYGYEFGWTYSIPTYAFQGCSGLISVTIPDSVTSIGSQAFNECTNLENVYAANLESWLNIRFSESYSTPMYYADNLYVDGELLTSVSIPDSITSIKSYAFFGCTCLTNVTISGSVTSVGYYAFQGCSGLTSVIISGSMTSIGYCVFSDCIGLISIAIPDNVTSIDTCAFQGCSGLTSVTIPNSVTSIGNYAFQGCSGLTNIEIPDSVTSIGSSVFSGCGSLIIDVSSDNPYYSSQDGVLFNKDMTEIAAYAKDKIVAEYTIPNSVISIGSGAFSGCTALTDFIIPSGITSIGNDAFSGCTSLSVIQIPSSITSIGASAFSNCTSLIIAYYEGTSDEWSNVTGSSYLDVFMIYETYDIDSDVEYDIGSGNCGDDVTWTLTSKGNFTINGSGDMEDYSSTSAPWYSVRSIIKNVEIADGITSIGSYAFSECGNLTSVTIPDSVISIGEYAFSDCVGLTSAEIPMNAAIDSNAFDGNVSIYGYNKSYAEVYASENGNEFVSVGDVIIDEMEVSTASELKAAITSNRKIILADGVYKYSGSLNIDYIVNLTIVAKNSGKAEILTASTHYAVVSVYNSYYITLDGIIMGHSGTVTCSAPVFGATYSSDVTLTNCDLFGCGITGVSLSRVCDFTAKNCIIRDCEEEISEFDSSDAFFSDCIISGNAYNISETRFDYGDDAYDFGFIDYGLECIYYYSDYELDVSFTNCTFVNNHNEELYDTTYADYITFTDCVFSDNAWDSGTPQNYGMCLNGITWRVEDDTLYLGYDIELEDGSVITSELGEVLPYSSSSLPWKKLTYSSIELADGIIYDEDTNTDPVTTAPVITDVSAALLEDESAVGVYVDIDNFTSGQAFAVGYSSGVLTSISETDEDGYAELTANTETVKVFIWDSLNSMIPLCEAATAAVE